MTVLMEFMSESLSKEEAKVLVSTLLVELSGSEISYTSDAANTEADSIVDGWVAGNGVKLW